MHNDTMITRNNATTLQMLPASISDTLAHSTKQSMTKSQVKMSNFKWLNKARQSLKMKTLLGKEKNIYTMQLPAGNSSHLEPCNVGYHRLTLHDSICLELHGGRHFYNVKTECTTHRGINVGAAQWLKYNKYRGTVEKGHCTLAAGFLARNWHSGHTKVLTCLPHNASLF